MYKHAHRVRTRPSARQARRRWPALQHPVITTGRRRTRRLPAGKRSTGLAAEGDLTANRRIQGRQWSLAARAAPADRGGREGRAARADGGGRADPTPSLTGRAGAVPAILARPAEAVPAILARPEAPRTTTARPRASSTGRATTAE